MLLKSSSVMLWKCCWALAQAAVEGALSSLANLADGCPEVRRAAGDAGAIELLVTCLQSAQNGASIIRQPANVREIEISVAKINCLLFWDGFCLCMQERHAYLHCREEEQVSDSTAKLKVPRGRRTFIFCVKCDSCFCHAASEVDMRP